MSDQIVRSQLNRLTLPDFGGGINSADLPTDIQDNQAVDILNLEYDDSNNLTSRNGVQLVSSFLWDTALWDVSQWDSQSSSFTNRITSLHHFQNDSGISTNLFTSGTKLYSMTDDGGAIQDITGALTLPSGNFGQWVTFQGLAILTNKATSGSNPVKVSGSSYPGTAAALGGSPPKAKYIEVWNSRLWLVLASNPNQIQASDLGQAETWNTDGGTTASHGFIFDIDLNDGDEITGIKAFKERLIVFKRKAIYTISAFAIPITDPDNLTIELFTRNFGCISPYSIQQVLDDIVFLSEGGVASLSAALITGDFKSSLLSRKIAELSSLNIDVDEIASYVVEDMQQYWISIPAAASPNAVPMVFVMDYRQIQQGVIRWTRFDSYAFGTAFTSFIDVHRNYIIATQDITGTSFFPAFYIPKDSVKVYTDTTLSYTKSVKTKAYGFNLNLIRKLYKYWKLALDVLSTSLQITINYFFNTKNTSDGDYAFNLTSISSGSMYDFALYDMSDTYDASTQSEQVIRRDFLVNASGKKARSVQFLISNNQLDQGMTIKQFDLGYFILSEKERQDID